MKDSVAIRFIHRGGVWSINFLGVEKMALLFICIFSQLFIIASPVREGSEFTSYFALLAIAI